MISHECGVVFFVTNRMMGCSVALCHGLLCTGTTCTSNTNQAFGLLLQCQSIYTYVIWPSANFEI